MSKLMKFFKDEEGATAVEYAIMVALIAAVTKRLQEIEKADEPNFDDVPF